MEPAPTSREVGSGRRENQCECECGGKETGGGQNSVSVSVEEGLRFEKILGMASFAYPWRALR